MKFKSKNLNETENESKLTVEKLKTYKGFEKMNDEQANEAVQSIKVFARIIFEIYRMENKLE